MSEIKLGSPKTIEVIEKKAQTVETDTVELVEILDSPPGKVVFATILVGEHPQKLTLWEGAAYDEVGNWTQEQAEARIIELLS